ncbi:MAG TPA: DivIVA domain-containing protein [Acidimicrobiales bacterium]
MTDGRVDQTQRPAQRLTPDRVRSMRFARVAIGRRGLSEEEVTQFLQRVADEIAARDASEASLRAKASHYKNTLVQWQREQSELRGDDDVTEPGPPRPTVEAINVLSRAQQEADAYIAQTQEYCKRLAMDAQQHARDILSDAQARAEAAAEDAVRNYRAIAGDSATAELEDLERRLAWARTFVTSLEAVEAQLRTAREALSHEFDKLGELAPPSGRIA